ncbi:MAG: type I-E CRISPR-associated protein Cse1/CasA [Verrucomicrobiae bacterium]|nr:type I-E CRISPR-associated protein Cse1/CasA [Verrucomicrobiae bacterium]MDW8345027.1 type I-E CRISPR-associated protein Cse1/CasA [Verrucomicrobiae bacterium]
MNISTEPWIPIVWTNGRAGMVSLCEAFERGEGIRDLAVRPHERIALMRLLICIAHAALDGPANKEDWKTCRSKIAPAALDYLKRWHHAFELFGEGQRFLQVEGLKKPTAKTDDIEGNLVSKLDLALATGNNPTLFDNGGGSERTFTPAQIALMLLTFQCFSPGGRIGVAEWDGTPTPGNGSSDHAPCIVGSMLHALVRGDNLLETIHYNLMSKERVAEFYGTGKWGQPVWEKMPTGLLDTQTIYNATETYLGRLVPLSRCIRLADDCRSLILANGLKYPEWREPTATIVTRKVKDQPTRVPLPASVEKAAWRELHALVVIAVDRNSNGGPAALTNVTDDAAFDLWTGGLAANKAKLVDTTESVFHVPATMLHEPSQRVYEDGVRWAENLASRLAKAVSAYHRELADNLDRAELRDRRQQIQDKATAQFWTDIEQAVPQLLDIATHPVRLGNNEWHKTDWGKTVWAAARAAYEHACPHDTPRQMRAYALGLNTLHFTPKTDEETEA